MYLRNLRKLQKKRKPERRVPLQKDPVRSNKRIKRTARGWVTHYDYHFMFTTTEYNRGNLAKALFGEVDHAE